uniref:F-box domain-containing protein n=1 Tax=Panagrolaimus davidi TaxID=227884 RepID=A0A914PXA2_9BILA
MEADENEDFPPPLFPKTDIKIPYFQYLPQSYQFVISNLLTILSENQNIESQKQILYGFSKKYSMLPEFWEYLHKIECDSSKQSEIITASLKQFSGMWFHEDMSTNEYDQLNKSILSAVYRPIYAFSFWNKLFREKEKQIFGSLLFPHGFVLHAFKVYEEVCGPITPDIENLYKKNSKLYQELVETFKEDPLKYFELALEAEDVDSQYQNIELLLGSRPYDTVIWGKYFKLLEMRNEKNLLLNLLERYCGLFLDDQEAKGKAVMLAANIELEKLTTTPDSPKRDSEDIYKTQSDVFQSVVNKFTFENASIQQPPFSSSIMSYIFTNLKAREYVKLKMCCKCFLNLLSKQVIHRIEIDDEPKDFYRNNLRLLYNDEYFPKMKNLWITTSMSISVQSVLNELIPRIACCEVKFITMFHQNLTMKEFNFLTDSGNVELLHMSECLITDEFCQEITLETMLEKIPKLYSLS